MYILFHPQWYLSYVSGRRVHPNEQQIAQSMGTAFQESDQYIQHLAKGKLDGYLDSLWRADKIHERESAEYLVYWSKRLGQ